MAVENDIARNEYVFAHNCDFGWANLWQCALIVEKICMSELAKPVIELLCCRWLFSPAFNCSGSSTRP